MTIDPGELAHWREWVGRTETREEVLDVEALRRFAAALGQDLDVERTPPSLAHWAFFLPVAPASEIGDDGHPRRGGFLPPVSLPRRMFAAAAMTFAAPLAIGRAAVRRSTVVDLQHKAGRSGDLILAEVEHRIEQDGALCVGERQTIVYRDTGASIPAIVAPPEAPTGDATWTPGPVELFRFSAVTFNSHRIHYDLPYATGEEGYPGLVVHGPLTATRLHEFAARGGRAPCGFRFRAIAPLFAGQPVALDAGDAAGEVRAVRCDGVTAMTASADF